MLRIYVTKAFVRRTSNFIISYASITPRENRILAVLPRGLFSLIHTASLKQ